MWEKKTDSSGVEEQECWLQESEERGGAGGSRRGVKEGKWSIEEVSVYILRMFGIPVHHQQPRARDKDLTKALRLLEQKMSLRCPKTTTHCTHLINKWRNNCWHSFNNIQWVILSADVLTSPRDKQLLLQIYLGYRLDMLNILHLSGGRHQGSNFGCLFDHNKIDSIAQFLMLPLTHSLQKNATYKLLFFFL